MSKYRYGIDYEDVLSLVHRYNAESREMRLTGAYDIHLEEGFETQRTRISLVRYDREITGMTLETYEEAYNYLHGLHDGRVAQRTLDRGMVRFSGGDS